MREQLEERLNKQMNFKALVEGMLMTVNSRIALGMDDGELVEPEEDLIGSMVGVFLSTLAIKLSDEDLEKYVVAMEEYAPAVIEAAESVQEVLVAYSERGNNNVQM